MQVDDAKLWLDPEEQQAWRALVRLVMKLPASLESDLQRRAGLSMYEYLVLSGLSEAPNRTLQMSELAAHANSSLSRLSHVISRMEKRDWVTRRVCPNNGRVNEASLTSAGWDKLVQAAPDHVRAVRSLVIDAFTPAQFRQLGVATAKLSRHIDELGADGNC